MSSVPQSKAVGKEATNDEADLYRQLSAAIFPDVFLPEGDVEPKKADISLTSPGHRWPTAKASQGPIDIEETIKEYAAQMIRKEGWTLPDKPMKSRYPPLPIDKDTLTAIIHRAHPVSVEQDLPMEEMVKLMPITPRSLDLDLQPVLPAHLHREVVEWLNRVLLRLAAARPVVGRVGAQGLGTIGHEGILHAIQLDGDYEMTESVEARIKGTYGEQHSPLSKQEARKARQKSLSTSQAKLNSLYERYI